MANKTKPTRERLALLFLVVLLLSGCSGNVRERSNNETINVQTCGTAQRVGAGSCNVQVWKLGGGN